MVPPIMRTWCSPPSRCWPTWPCRDAAPTLTPHPHPPQPCGAIACSFLIQQSIRTSVKIKFAVSGRERLHIEQELTHRTSKNINRLNLVSIRGRIMMSLGFGQRYICNGIGLQGWNWICVKYNVPYILSIANNQHEPPPPYHLAALPSPSIGRSAAPHIHVAEAAEVTMQVASAGCALDTVGFSDWGTTHQKIERWEGSWP